MKKRIEEAMLHDAFAISVERVRKESEKVGADAPVTEFLMKEMGLEHKEPLMTFAEKTADIVGSTYGRLDMVMGTNMALHMALVIGLQMGLAWPEVQAQVRRAESQRDRTARPQSTRRRP